MSKLLQVNDLTTEFTGDFGKKSVWIMSVLMSQKERRFVSLVSPAVARV